MHVLNRPADKQYVFIPDLKQKIVSAVTINGKKAVKTKQYPEGTFVYLDDVPADDVDSIIVLQLQ